MIKMKSVIKKLLFFVILLSTAAVFAQSKPPTPAAPPPGFPLDALLYVLAGAGLGYGIWKKKK